MAHIGAIGDARMFHTLGGSSISGRPFPSRRKPTTPKSSPSRLNTASPSTSTSTNTRSTSTHSDTNARPLRTQFSMPTPNVIDLKTISAEEMEWEGFVYKQRKLVKSWTPRYITLQNRTITVYKTKAHAIAKEPIRGRWVIHQILTKLPSTGFGSSKLHPDLLGFGFLASNGNLIHLIATSWIDKRVWIFMMRQALNRSSAETSAALFPPSKPELSSPPKMPNSASMSKLSEASNSTNLQKSKSTDNIHKSEGSILKHLADQFLSDLVLLLCAQDMDILSNKLPLFLRQLSKDVEIWFDLETMEMNQSCVFKGIYHGREGFVHFIALFITKYAFMKNIQGETLHRAEDDEHHGYACFHNLVNLVSNSTTRGKFSLQLSFTPARRVSRVILSFRCRSSSSSRSNKARRKSPSNSSSATSSTTSSSSNPVAISQHPSCFHQAYLTKRSLAISFADFDVVGVLGQGGFGTVVLVQRHHNPEEYFAIKIIDKHSGAESALKERRILSGVRHPFLACLRFAFQTSTKLYLGLDYYKGGNLYHHMHSASSLDPNRNTTSGRRFTIERVRFYAAELAIALSYLHQNGIIYRDLKPDNIMLDRFGHIRLVDFGISKQLQQVSSVSVSDGYGSTGTIAGSPAYIAPEQLVTQKPQYGMQADWWSYGVLLYEMVTGSTPFHDSNISQMYRKIQSEEVNYSRKPLMDEDVKDLLQHLLVRDPSQRYGMEQVKNHVFFCSIDWDLLEKKEINPPFIPPAEELMQNVHTHFRNMKVQETIGDNDGPKSGNKKGRKDANVSDSHFDEFSFAYDTTRETFDGLSMADDGWLMQQFAEGAAVRERLQAPEMEEHIGGVSEDEEGEMKTTGSTSSGSPHGLKTQTSSEIEDEEEVEKVEF